MDHTNMTRQNRILRAGVARAIIPTSLLLALSTTAFSGPELKAEAKHEKKIEKPLLSFADGLLQFDIEARARFEARNNTRDFDDAVNDDNDDSWLLTRFRLGLALKPLPWLKLYAQTQDVREIDSDRPNIPGVHGTEGFDEFDLRQAYVEFANYKEFPLGLTVGRQRLHYGDRRLVADSNWNNFGRTFDGVKLRLQREKWWVEAFAARPVQIRKNVINDSDAADNFFGFYASSEALSFQTTDLYLFYRDKGDNQPDLDPTNSFDPDGSWNGPAQRIATIGTRWKSKKDALGPWDYTVELAYQWGDVWATDRSTPALDHHAFAAGIAGGYTVKSFAWEPRFGLGYDFASGDRNPDDGRSQSFQNLFPSNHEPYGLIDEFAWRNLHDLHFEASVEPAKNLELEVQWHVFWLAETNDYWFRSNGVSTLRTKTPDGRDVRRIGADNFAGQEVDLTLTWSPVKPLKIIAGYGHFFAGDYLRDTGPHDDADFGYIQAQLLF